MLLLLLLMVLLLLLLMLLLLLLLLMVLLLLLLLTNLPGDDCSGLTASHCCWRCWCRLLLALAAAGADCVVQVCVSLNFAFFHFCGRLVSHMGHPI